MWWLATFATLAMVAALGSIPAVAQIVDLSDSAGQIASAERLPPAGEFLGDSSAPGKESHAGSTGTLAAAAYRDRAYHAAVAKAVQKISRKLETSQNTSRRSKAISDKQHKGKVTVEGSTDDELKDFLETHNARGDGDLVQALNRLGDRPADESYSRVAKENTAS